LAHLPGARGVKAIGDMIAEILAVGAWAHRAVESKP
jgi:hypothetical protein